MQENFGIRGANRFIKNDVTLSLIGCDKSGEWSILSREGIWN